MAYEAKTKPTAASVEDYLAKVTPAQRQADARALVEIMGRVTGEPATMWGPSMIGFGSQSFRYETGHSGVMPAVAFAPRKTALVLYIGGAATDENCARLGKATHSVSCVYVKRLADIDTAALEAIIRESLAPADQAA